MFPVMPSLIPIYQETNFLGKLIVEQDKTVKVLQQNLLQEQKKLEIIWELQRKEASQQNKFFLAGEDLSRAFACDRNIKHTKSENQVTQWCFLDVFKDLEDSEEEESNFQIEDLVVEEVTKHRAYFLPFRR